MTRQVAEIAMQDADNPVVQGLMSLLLKYGRHTIECWSVVGTECDCGWDELKRDLQGAVDG